MNIKDENCAYCMGGELIDKFAYPLCKLDSCTVHVFKEQSNYGRVICAHNKHVSELIDLTDSERNDFFADIAKVSKAIHKAFKPNKVNYGAYGDTGCHLHFHLVPKYKDGSEWGSTFTMNKGEVLLSDEEYEKIAQLIRDNM